MTATIAVRETPLCRATLKELAHQEGPCISLLIPGYMGGAQQGSRSLLVQRMTRTAAQKGSANGLDIVGLLEPVQEFAANLNGAAGSRDVALFRSADLFLIAPVGGVTSELVTVGGHFHVAPFVAAALSPQKFHVLALHRKNLHLYRYSNGKCEPVPLPATVPPDMATALGFDTPDHNREGRSGVATGTGAGTAVQFGTSSDKESAGEYLHHYLQLIDRGLKELTPATPLLLAGVHEEVAAFRRVAQNTTFLQAEIKGDVDFLSMTEMAARCAEAAAEHYRCLGEIVLAEFREMRDRSKALAGVREVLDAAQAGRVHQVCVAEGAHEAGPQDEDLVNAAIMETLRGGGDVFMLPAAAMPNRVTVAAILRF